ncbi:MAG: hypothetical protein H6672_05845 [Anaerolineaceae bacterium]|nr:hypothetical protein [Anaerolineaceae bacterium]
MTTKPRLTDVRWSDVVAEARAILIEQARLRQTITYAELCTMMQTARIHYHSNTMVRLLDDIGRMEYEAGRPVLPAVVVTKQTGIPGAGYFRLPGTLPGEETPADAEAIWGADLQAVFDYWSEH